MVMGWFDWFEKLRAEWPAVTAARWAIFIGIGLGFAVGFGIATYVWSERLSTLKERVDLYKDRLQGASPDEAAKQITELKTQVAALVAESQNQWKFTDKDQTTLEAAMAKEPKKISFAVIPVPASPSATAYAYSLLKFMGWGKGWGVSVHPFDAFNSPEDTGLKIAVRKGTDPNKNENAQILKRVLENLGYKIPFTNDPRIENDEDIILVVGKHP